MSAHVDGFSPENANRKYDHAYPSFYGPQTFNHSPSTRAALNESSSQYHVCQPDRPLSSPCLIRKRGDKFVKTTGTVARVGRRIFGRRWPRKFEHTNACNRWIHSYTMCCTQKFVTSPWASSVVEFTSNQQLLFTFSPAFPKRSRES